MISTRLKNLLEQNGIPFEVVPHDPAFTAQQLAARMHVPGREFVKTVVVRVDGRYALAAVPAHRLVDEKALARVARAGRCVLASEAEFRELFPDCELGAMPPVGNLYGLETYVDAEVTRDETVVANAGTHAEAIRVRYADLARLARPTVGRFAVPTPAEIASRRKAGKARAARAASAGRGGRTRGTARKKTTRAKTPRRRASAKKKAAARKTTARRRKTAGARAVRAKTARGKKSARGKTAPKKPSPKKKAAARKTTARRRKTASGKSRHR
jgi:Ala-tRNA(Pro) deacylase